MIASDPPSAAPAAEPASASERVRPPRGFDLRRALRRFNPASKLWFWSTRARRAGWYPVALALKTLNFAIFHCSLSYDCELAEEVEMPHFGMGCVVHPNVTLGRRVKMFHHVLLAAAAAPAVAARIVVEDDVTIGAHVIVLGGEPGGIRIGKGAVIGAGSIVTRDVMPGATIVPLPSRPVKVSAQNYS